MKTTSKNKSKNLTLILGVIVAIIASVSTTVNAHSLPPMPDETSINVAQHNTYTNYQEKPFSVEIYNRDLELIYQGAAENLDPQAQTLVLRSDLIIKDANSALYLINE